MTTLDNFDHRILELLQSDGRMTITDLSDQIGLSKTPCLKRVQKLETAGYIKGYQAIINHDLIDNNHIAFVQIKLNDTKTMALNAFNKAIKEVPEERPDAKNVEFKAIIESIKELAIQIIKESNNGK